MVDRFAPDHMMTGSGMIMWRDGGWVRYSDYARIQEQVETLRKERDRAVLHLSAWEDSARINLHRAEAAEAERDRLREAIERVLSPAPGVRKPEPWVYGILKVALQKEPQPLAQERDDGR